MLTSIPMKTAITKTTDTDTTFTVVLDDTHLASIKTSTIEKLRHRVKVAGFRPGKAPDHIVERELGDATVQSEVLDAAISESYAHALNEHGLAVIAPPSVNVTKFVPFIELEYTATVDIMPDIKLFDYKAINQPQPEVKVEPSEIDQTIEDLRKRMATKSEVQRAAQVGDEVNIDFDGSKGGQPVAGAQAKNYTLTLGSNAFIPGFEEKIVGLTAGQVKNFKITFPKDYQASDLAGAEVEFKVNLHKVNEVQLPSVDAAFVASISTLTSVDELRADIEARIKAEKYDHAMQEFEQSILDQIVDKSKWSASPRLIDAQITRLKSELEDRLASNGLDLEKYLTLSKKTATELDSELRPTAKRRVGLALILNQIAKAEQITVSAEDINSELARLKSDYQDPQMQDELERREIKDEIYNHLLASKTVAKIMDYVAENAKKR